MQIEGGIHHYHPRCCCSPPGGCGAKKAIDRTTLLLGLLPAVLYVAAVLVQLSIHGIIPFHMAIFSPLAVR